MVTRAEHLAWCKERALAELDAGNIQGAYNSMLSDMMKHPETSDYIALAMMRDLMEEGYLDSEDKMRKFIEEFK